MARVSKQDREKQGLKFIEKYLETGNQSEAARFAGCNPKYAHKRGSEWMQDPFVKERISRYQAKNLDLETDGSETIDDIFGTSGSVALRSLADKAKTDSSAAKQFLELKLKFDKLKKEELGEYEGFSTAELLRDIDKELAKAEELKHRALEAFGEAQMSE